MRVTVGKKLGLGFGIVIVLMALSTIVAYQKVTNLESSVEVAVDQSLPSMLTCSDLGGDINGASSYLRAYMLLGDNPENAKLFKSLRSEAWRELETHLTQLKTLSQNWESAGERQVLSGFVTILEEFREAQQKVENIAHTEENIKPVYVMTTVALPLTDKMGTTINAVLSEEANIDATPERKAMFYSFAKLQEAFLSATSELRSYLIRGDQDSRRRAEQLAHTLDEAQIHAASFVDLLSKSQRANWERYVDAYHEFGPLSSRLIAMRAAPDWNQANYIFESEVVPRSLQMREKLKSLQGSIGKRVVEHRKAIFDTGRAVTTTLIGAALAAIVIASIVAVSLSRKIVAGIQAVSAAARQVAGGDLTGNEIRVRSKDEVGELAGAFNGMRAGLKDMAEQIRQATENVNSTAAEMLASTQQQAAATKEQAATVQEITTTLEEVNQSGSQIGDRAKQVSATVAQASDVTKRGMTATRETNETMQSIRDQVEEVAENVVSVSERTQTIGDIIATVSDIAEQSNLLALNASIEAASAGDQGSRFAVVAHEMKNLADRAKDCTVQVRTILGEIQKGINTSVMMTEEAVKRVEVGKQKATATETTIREVTETNDESIRAFQQIIAGTNQQQIGVSQVTQGMQDIRQAIEQTAAGTAQMEKAAANMNALSQQLKNAVGDTGFEMDIQEQVIQAFQIEHREQIEGIRSILTSLDPQSAAPNDPRWEEAFRMAHTLKGGARVCDFHDLEALGHRMESLFAGVREGSLGFSHEVADTIFRVLDAIEDWMAAFAAGGSPTSPAETLDAIDSCLRASKERLAIESAHSTKEVTSPSAESSAALGPQSAGSHEIETLRVQTGQLDKVLRSTDALLSVNADHERLANEIGRLSTEVHALQRECEAIRVTAGPVRRCLSARPEFACVARHLDAVAQLSRRITKQQRIVGSAHYRYSWALRTVTADLRRDVQQTRMISAENVLQGLRPMVRSLAREEGKEVDFRVAGLDLLADRMVLQAIKDPLVHVLRNAIVHGIEPPDVREAQSKSRVGNVALTLRAHSNRLHVLVEDDGRGINAELVAHEAAKRGLLTESTLDWESNGDQLTRLLFRAGFSTSSTVNELAGRGMGLSVVHETIARLRGNARIGPRSGPGTALEISVPLFISAERLLLVSCAGQVFGLPIDGVDRLLRLRTADVQNVEGRRMAIVDDSPLPLRSLAQAVGFDASTPAPDREVLTVVVLSAGSQRAGFIVDAVLKEREALIKEIDAPAADVKHFTGAILLEDNDVALVVDPPYLLANLTASMAPFPITENAQAKKTSIVLIVDDSFTTRTLEKSILETNGYDVRVAVDGVEALTILRSEPIDIVIADIEMPRLNGLALLKEVRGDIRLASLPVVLVTSLDRQEDRQRGMDLGANAYIVKRRFDHQELLNTIQKFL